MSGPQAGQVETAEPAQKEVASNKLAIEHQAQALIQRAAAAGFHVAIEPRPLQPLAMRHYELVVTVWEKR